MGQNIDNLEFQEISKLPVTEYRTGAYIIISDENPGANDAKKYPLPNLATQAQANDLAVGKADKTTVDNLEQRLSAEEKKNKHDKGYYDTEAKLFASVPNPIAGDYANVAGTQYDCEVAGTWINTGDPAPIAPLDLTDYTQNGGYTGTSQKLFDSRAHISKSTNDFWLHPTGKIVIDGANVTLVNLAYYGQNYYSTFFNTITLEATTNFAIIIGTVDTSISGDVKPGKWTIETFEYAAALNGRLNSLATNEVALMHRTDGVWFSAYNLVQKFISQSYFDAKMTAYAPVSSVTNDFSRTTTGLVEIEGIAVKITGLRFAHKSGNVNHLNDTVYFKSENDFDYIVANTPTDGSLMTLNFVSATTPEASALYNQKYFNDETKTILVYKVDGVWNSSYAEIRKLLDVNTAFTNKKNIFTSARVIQSSEYTTGFYIDKDTGIAYANPSYRYVDLDIEDDDYIYGIDLTASIGGSVGVVSFFDSSGVFKVTTETITGAIIDGSDRTWRKPLYIPFRTSKMRLCTTIYNDIILWKGKKKYFIPSAFESLKITWTGTSIPMDNYPVDGYFSYPNVVGKLLNATVENQSVGSSGMVWDGTRALSLSATRAELTAAGFDPNQSYETKVIGKNADLLVLDHGFNDRTLAFGAIESTDKSTLYGAYNVVIQAALADNPKLKLLFVTPPNRFNDASVNTSETQIDAIREVIHNLATKYASPVCDLAVLSNINSYNYNSYKRDKVHTKGEDRERLAYILAQFISGMK